MLRVWKLNQWTDIFLGLETERFVLSEEDGHFFLSGEVERANRDVESGVICLHLFFRCL